MARTSRQQRTNPAPKPRNVHRVHAVSAVNAANGETAQSARRAMPRVTHRVMRLKTAARMAVRPATGVASGAMANAIDATSPRGLLQT